jgi:hypothetical protein
VEVRGAPKEGVSTDQVTKLSFASPLILILIYICDYRNNTKPQ